MAVHANSTTAPARRPPTLALSNVTQLIARPRRPREIDQEALNDVRRLIAEHIDLLILVLDTRDPDPDLEPDECAELSFRAEIRGGANVAPSETIAREIASLADDCRDYTRDAHGVYLMAVGAGMDMPSAADHLGPITNAAALIYTALKG